LLLAAATDAGLAIAEGSFAVRPEVKAFIAEMHERHGLPVRKMTRAFSTIKPLPAVIKAILPPSDPAVRSWQAYRARFVEPKRIALGQKFWRQHHAALATAREQTGVPEEFVLAIIGIESIYGRHTGNFATLAALATLAFDYPQADGRGEIPGAASRAALFRGELEQLLLLAREVRRDPLSFKGSYAGALGLPQFLPSSIRRFAVDGDGDGRIDLATSPADAIASVAHFLKEHGWEKDGPVAATATAEGEKFRSLIEEGIMPRRTPAELADFGVVTDAAPNLPAALIDLVTPHEPVEYRLGYRNFYVLTRYNRSSFYAMAVLDLAMELRAGHASSQ